MITFEDFSKLELRVGKVLEVTVHPNADKLYVVKVDIGEKAIQLVAGVRKNYTAEELLGKLVIVAVNLEPRSLRGVESQGMILAAKNDEMLTVLTTDREIKPGSVVG